MRQTEENHIQHTFLWSLPSPPPPPTHRANNKFILKTVFTSAGMAKRNLQPSRE